ncbi:flagellin [Pelomonas sp. SE-A7]|uniref:flagellin N-terminal helical domain-containing protein n=1 Tax=Pelomonas sp. SE-A7 TaxID=3054953 RepID=UPI00259CFAE0|nr:flagellin [Pelomonas sp. SE-A7]MDM4764507.1 flagellin [Pelomonas sp. SE-A7]
MPAIINTNLASLNAQRAQAASQLSLQTSMQRLSSGLRVNSSKDDAAGLAIAERMNTQVRGMTVAIRNANDGISLSQTAEGALSKVGDALQRMRELAVQGRNSTNTTTDLGSLGKEYAELSKEITRVVAGTTFNGKAILAADSGTQTFQIGANTTSNDVVDVVTTDLTADATITAVTGATFDDTSTAASLGTIINDIDTALNSVNSQRAVFGASQNRFDAVISNLMVSVENQTAARSRIMDADFASETANLSRASILQQAGTAMISQANQMPQQVLRLLQ